MSARFFRGAVSALVLASSGLYFFVYLYRWEWNRALIAAAIFIMMEIVVAAGAILTRLRALEAHLTETVDAHALTHIKETAPAPRPRFRWLTGGDQVPVFVPVLMGAGLVVSGIAWIVERLAHATARPVMEYRLALSLAPLALPEGGFLADRPLPAVKRPGRRSSKSFAVLAVAALLAVAVDEMGDLTQTRPDVVSAGMTTSFTIRVDSHGWSRSDASAVESLWAVCRATVPASLTHSAWQATGPRTFGMTFDSSLGEHTVRQLRGCIEDTTLDNVQARVMSLTMRDS